MPLVLPWEVALSSCAITASSHLQESSCNESNETLPPSSTVHNSEPWTARLDIAIRHIENLIAQDQLMEADRALFLASEQFGWNQALDYLQQSLDHRHRKSKEVRISRWLDEAESDQLAGRLDEALEKLGRAVVLATDDETRSELEALICNLRRELAERKRSQAMLSGSGEAWGVNGLIETEQAIAQRSIDDLISAGQFDKAANALEIAIDQWGMDEEWNALYTRIVLESTEASALPGKCPVDHQLADLLVQATIAMESEDRFKARLLVAEVLNRQPDHQAALDLAQRLDD